jgi:hypothetical protein
LRLREAIGRRPLLLLWCPLLRAVMTVVAVSQRVVLLLLRCIMLLLLLRLLLLCGLHEQEHSKQAASRRHPVP